MKTFSISLSTLEMGTTIHTDSLSMVYMLYCTQHNWCSQVQMSCRHDSKHTFLYYMCVYVCVCART